MIRDGPLGGPFEESTKILDRPKTAGTRRYEFYKAPSYGIGRSVCGGSSEPDIPLVFKVCFAPAHLDPAETVACLGCSVACVVAVISGSRRDDRDFCGPVRGDGLALSPKSRDGFNGLGCGEDSVRRGTCPPSPVTCCRRRLPSPGDISAHCRRPGSSSE